ncbi:MAG: aldose epimerase family protein [Anditalea sp.]
MKNYLILILAVLFFSACNSKNESSEGDNNTETEDNFKHLTMEDSDFNKTLPEGEVKLYRLKNKNGLEMEVTNFGARVVSLFVPDREGNFEDVVLGYDTVDEYINHPTSYFGAPIGRYGNRIANAQFTLNGETYQLEANNGPNNLHGWPGGYHNVVWNVEEADDQKLVFSYVSEDGHGGFPGTLTVKMTYALTDNNEFKIDYEAETDQSTIVNLTHHSFFNLNGAGKGDVLNHKIFIDADYYTPVDSVLIPTGEIAPVEGTPMDFTTPHIIGERVDDDFEQLEFAGGYDHNWVLNKEEGELGAELAAAVWVPENGRKMEVYTTEPGIQFYGGNFLDNVEGKDGQTYVKRGALCLETQHFPDSPNQSDFPSVVLNPGEKYAQTCTYKFSVEE